MLIGDRDFDAEMVYDAGKDKFTTVINLKKSGKVREIPERKKQKKDFVHYSIDWDSLQKGLLTVPD